MKIEVVYRIPSLIDKKKSIHDNSKDANEWMNLMAKFDNRVEFELPRNLEG